MKALFFILFSFLFAAGSAQPLSPSEKLSGFVKNINDFSYRNPQEKVYLHFDNTGYFVGENIWFKAYVVNAGNNHFSTLSATLYVELLDSNGGIVETQKIRLVDGQGDGNILLKDLLKPGYFEVRAYTRYMLNFDVNNVFSRVFPVFSKPKQEGDYRLTKLPAPGYNSLTQRERPARTKKVNLSFFPEGGHSVVGLRSKMAFKATGATGEDLDLEGVVYNQDKEEVAAFKTLHRGMGMFEYTPQAGAYKVTALYNGKEYDFDLPDPVSDGYALSVNNLDENVLLIHLQKSLNHPSESVGISVSCRGKVYSFEVISFEDEDSFSLHVPKDRLPAGCLQVTVFDSSGQVLAERLAFNGKYTHTPLTVKQDKDRYSAFDKISLDFSLADSLETAFSLSVRDSDTEVPTNYGGDILTTLLLSSEVRGYVSDPSYYFEESTRNRRLLLDLLMLVQGWRRYDWQLLSGVKPFVSVHPIEKGILVEGRVLSLLRKREVDNVEVTQLLTSKDYGFSVGSCFTDSAGRFNFLHDIAGVWDMTLQTRETKKSKSRNQNFRVLLDRNFSPVAKSFSYYETRLDQQKALKPEPLIHRDADMKLTGERFSSDDDKSHLLKEVEVKGKVDGRESEAFAKASVIYDVKMEVDKIRDAGEYEDEDIWFFLSRINPYFTYKYNHPEKMMSSEYNAQHPAFYFYKGKKVIFVVDDQRVGTATSFYRDISEVSVGQIESIAIVEENEDSFKHINASFDIEKTLFDSEELPESTNTDPMYSMIHENNVTIYIYTNKDGGRRRPNNGIRPTKLVGYSVADEFYHSDYSKTALVGDWDYRRTLYWNPNVKTDKNGKASVSFYNNSTCKQITISAEGLTDSGVPMVLKK